jgi:hypothetical protein
VNGNTNHLDKGGTTIMLKRSLGALLALALATAACQSNGSDSGSLAASSAPSGTQAPSEPILGTWQNEYTCENMARGFDEAGIAELVPDWLVGLGLQKGPADRLTSDNLCEGARQIERRHYFRPNGYLINYQGTKIVDDCRCYLLVDDHTFVSLGESGSPDVSLEYTIEGDVLTFSVVRPDPCSTAKCLGTFAFTVAQYAVGSWKRVS